MNTLNRLKELFLENWLTLLAILVLLAALVGNVFYYVSNIAPALATRDQISAQIRNARDALVESRRVQNEPPATVQARLISAQSKMTSIISPLVSITQTNAFIDLLYQYADASHIVITDLQNQSTNLLPTPTPTPLAAATPTRAVPTLIPSSATGASPAAVQTVLTPTQPVAPTPTRPAPTLAPTVLPERDIFYAKVLKIQASGSFHQINEFLSRIKEFNCKPVILTSLNIAGTESRATLNLEITLYLSSTAAGTGPIGAPIPTNTTPLRSFASGTGAIGAPTPTSAIPPRSAQPVVQPAIAQPQPSATPLVPNTATPIAPATSSPTAAVTATPTASLTATPSQRTLLYTVVPGDTLFSIARRYNTTPESIANANHLTSSLLRIGQPLIVPLQ